MRRMNWACVVCTTRFKPKSVSERCDTRDYRLYRFTFRNGAEAVGKVDHGTSLKAFCIDRHQFEDELMDTPATRLCQKGSIRYLPQCVPG